MQPVKSKKQLYKLLPPELQGLKTKKLIGKVFSIGASNYWNVFYANMVLTFVYENEHIKCTGAVYLNNLTVVPEIKMNNLTFVQSGLTIDPTRFRHLYFLTSDDQVLETGITDYRSIKQFCVAHQRSDFVKISSSYSDVVSEITKRHLDCFRKLEWNEFSSYSGLLCIKDCGVFRKGMMIDTYYNYLNYKYYNRSPLDLVNGGNYASMYSISGSLGCDLSKVTLDQLEAISTAHHSCYKQKYGCQRGCTSSCASDSANSYDSRTKQIFIKLWKECFTN